MNLRFITELSKKQKYTLLILSIITFISTLWINWTFNYWDGQTLMAWSVNNWDLLVEGRWSDFYSDKLLNVRGAIQLEGMGSPFMIIPQMLWCFPIWVTHYFNGNMYVGTIGCVYWYKAFLFLITVFIAYECFRLIYRFSENTYNSCIGFLLVCASSEFLLSTGYCGQDEVCYLLFSMIALRKLLDNKYKAFILYSTIAVTLCPIIILPIAVMLLFKEKRLLHIIISAIIMVSPTIFWGIVSRNMEGKYIQTSISGHAARILDYVKIPVMSGYASILVFLLVILCFYAWLTPNASDKKITWFTSLPVIYLSVFTDSFFYRSILYIPFIVVLIFMNNNGNNDLKILLITILEYVRFFALGIDSPQTMNTVYTSSNKHIVSLCQFFGTIKYESYDSLVGKIIDRLPILHDLGWSLNGLCLAIIAILLWLSFSEKNEAKASTIRVSSKTIFLYFYTLCIPFYMAIFYLLLIH